MAETPLTMRDHILAIHAKHGRLTPELVVEEARPKTSPLHTHVFDRPPKEAAEAWYRTRAHELIQSVRVVYREADESGPAQTVRAFHAVQSETGYVYEPLEVVIQDDFTKRLVLTTMEREWKQLFNRYESFAEFLAMVAEDVTKAA